SICRSSVTICSGLYFLVGIPALLQSEFSLTSAGTKNPGQVSLYFLVGIPALLQSEFSLTSAGTKNPGQVTILSVESTTVRFV
ncbi:MAG: hypothetical protein WBE13_14460, partial [Candidatus Acidiferrum sp.]